jgi:glycosyltransferase involved in cell wall biosynthesis
VLLACQQDCIPQWLQAADLFVLPSQSEGMSNAIQEAMACGLPVVARRAGGNPELVEHGISGLLYDGQDPVGAGPALWRLLRDPALRVRLGAAGRALVESKYCIEANVDRLEKLLIGN